MAIAACASSTESLPGASTSSSPSSDGAQIVFSRRTGVDNSEFLGLYAVREDGSGAAPFLPGLAGADGHFESIGFSPDSAQVAMAVVTNDQPATAVANADGSDYRLLEVSQGSLALVCEEWSPDGLRLVCTGILDSRLAGIYTVRAEDGQDLERVTDIPEELERTHTDLPCSYSPDGGQIAFIRLDTERLAGDGDLYVVNSDGSDERLISSVGLDFGCEWSPTGDTILGAGDGGKLLLIGLDGSETVVSRPAEIVNVYAPSFSPDGSSLVFSASTSPNAAMDIYTMRLDGSDLRQLTDTPDHKEEMAEWAP